VLLLHVLERRLALLGHDPGYESFAHDEQPETFSLENPH
jgi:hypothetical protein